MLTVQQLSQELGVSVDTLRVWERRYGFPQPQRDRRGHRRYPLDQVAQLHIVRKLQSLGYRPNSLFAMSADERHQLLDSYVAEDENRARGFQSLVLSASLDELEQVLRYHLATTTIEHFILHCSAEVLACLDRGWISGELTIAREHAISDRIQKILLEILGQQQDTDVASPLMLFVTINGERHHLALLMAAVLFSRQGVRCQWLLEDLPMSELPDLVYATACHGVALSFSSHYSSLQARSDLVTLRRMLPESCHIVAGGSGIASVYQIPGTTVVDDLGEVEAVSRTLFQRK
ncbi:MerR family transcriptional regulator [Desulfuromonas acetoxidans]|uniref:Transcriptional regulator, MerR family n=1 Tax=Desulfuromonas acetoxidans (strain DSM 684 / 11070) TaxID=281689 RepID=Q1K010_DESA6|nr:MerR family transcriptional regulator [Desulfuromonas acetoxidans]EAT15732.1 transcriptional regulator, MerR family [Desulfuromonas acetoxidans DSM 684]MBF0646012.1 MerR family transcriptional regulator [Desulfuromonas acetoxidans]NVD25877.1 MerR family transcriptional regulator [Desulfuromonas acetoxidans]NVE16909.1 MerR family transcriptional regulator [Desulfuromonas acetoxidans]